MEQLVALAPEYTRGSLEGEYDGRLSANMHSRTLQESQKERREEQHDSNIRYQTFQEPVSEKRRIDSLCEPFKRLAEHLFGVTIDIRTVRKNDSLEVPREDSADRFAC